MAQIASPGETSNIPIRPLIVTSFAVAVFFVLAYWGGLPPADQVPKFIIGVIALVGVAGIVVGLAWYLLFRPVSYPIARRSPLTDVQRQLLGLGLIIATLMEGIGGAWDESWHMLYGIPFGKDLFWRPHILIYASLIAFVVFGVIAWSRLLSRGKGNWVQRFRGDPLLGILILAALYMLFAVPADPIWHTLYGNDISAFSIPHVSLALTFVISFLLGIGLVVSGQPVRTWRTIFNLRTSDFIPLLSLIFMVQVPVSILFVDWYTLTPADLVRHDSPVFQRPEWVLPVFVVFVATLVGTLANQLLRTFGTATLVGIGAFILRVLLLTLVKNPDPHAIGWLLCLPPLVTIDVLYAVSITRKQPIRWWMSGLAAAVGNLGALLLISRFILYPQVTLSNLPGMIVFPTIAALMAALVGVTIGNSINAQGKPAVAQPEARTIPAWLTPTLLAGVVAFVVWFVVTAPPPYWAS